MVILNQYLSDMHYGVDLVYVCLNLQIEKADINLCISILKERLVQVYSALSIFVNDTPLDLLDLLLAKF